MKNVAISTDVVFVMQSKYNKIWRDISIDEFRYNTLEEAREAKKRTAKNVWNQRKEKGTLRIVKRITLTFEEVT